MSTTYLVLIGREAVCYSTSLDVAKTVAALRVHLPLMWKTVSSEVGPDRVPYLTTLNGVSDVPALDWVEEFGGYTANPFLRIEKLTLHDKALPPMPITSQGRPQ